MLSSGSSNPSSLASDLMISVEVNNRQKSQSIDEKRLAAAVRAVLSGEGFTTAEVSLAIVGDEEMHELNRRHLSHDYPTDVLSFLLDGDEEWLEGEVIASAEYAARSAPQFSASLDDELMLYIVHGTLHLAGYDDQDDDSRRQMRAKEKEYLAPFGISISYDEAARTAPAGGSK